MCSFFMLLPSVKAERIEHEDLIVEFDPPLQKAVEEVIAIYPELKMALERVFEWPLDFKPKIILTLRREDFPHLSASPLVLAYAQPQNNLIVMDYSKMTTDPFTFKATLKHELSHLLLHHHIKEEYLPKWLDEGLAQWVSGGISEILMGGKGIALKQADLRGDLIPLTSLVQTFPSVEKARLLAYAESKSVVEFIDTAFGSGGIRAILAHLKAGEDIDAALQKGLSISMETLEARWRADLGDQITWFAYFGDNLVLILFSFGGLLTIYGFIHLLIRKKRYREKEEEEEILKKLFENFHDHKNKRP